MKKQFLFFLVLMLWFNASAQRNKYNFNPGWKLYVGDIPEAYKPELDDALWKEVTLPRAWNEDDAFKKDIVDLSTGISWYRKHFIIPSSNQPQKIFVEFEGIRQAGEFYINGQKIGIHENGVMAFGFDLTPYINLNKENVIAVRINNSWDYRELATNTKFQWEDKNFNANYGGICKNVFLHVTSEFYQTLPLNSLLQTKGVYVYADGFNIKTKSATIHAESQVRNESGADQTVQYQVKINDLDNKHVAIFNGNKQTIKHGSTATLSAEKALTGLNFWSWGYGYLYNVQTILLVDGKPVDIVNTKTGFRKTEFKNGMIYLNDRVIQVHGYAQRTSNEWPAIGMSVPAWMSDYSNRLMVESNGNLVRWMHITPWKQDIESCDRVGLLQAMQAGDAEHDVEGVRWLQRKAVMRDAIIYNRNNPSIIFYECGNESISEAHMNEMKEIRDEYDPHGGRAIGSREMLNSKVAEYGGEMLYVNKSANIPMWAMEYSRDEGLRKYWDDYSPPFHKDGDGPLLKGQPAKEYNRNMESHAVEDAVRWYDFWKQRPGTGRRVSSGGVNIVFSETNTHHRGAENYRRSGEVDALRIPKENFYAHQVIWNGWVDAENPGIHIIGHWNYAPGVVKDVFVISTADKVELKVNGTSLGYGSQSSRFVYTFRNINYKAGNISAVGYDAKGKTLCSTQKNTAGDPVAIRLTSIKNPNGFIADGHDVAIVEVEVVDAKGNRCPTALNMVNFSLDGEAEWRGGMAQGPENYILSKQLPVEGGVNRVLIRSTTKAGTVVIKATAESLQPASLILQTKTFVVNNGLAKSFPSTGLPSNLQRGPTPGTPSFKTLRNALAIVKTSAGANPDSSFSSYDDNELSDWHNDGKLSTAWIEYELEKPSVINEIDLKLNNFRSRSYPLVVTVDGVQVFSGNTERSLGYVTLICKPATGKKIRVQLSKSATDVNNSMVEVSGKKLDDGVSRDDVNAKGTLSIIEAEIYKKVTPVK